MSGNAVYIDITLDKPRRMLFDMNAMAAYESATGENFLDWANIVKGLNITRMRALLWAGLIHEDENLKLKDVGAMINANTIGAISDSILKAVAANAPEVERSNGEARPLP